MKIPSWSPPVHVRPVLCHARRRYQQLSPAQRPALHGPQSYLGLFEMTDLITLAQHGYWPLPQEALAWLAEPRADRAHRWRRTVRRMEKIIRNLIADELPEAVAAVTEGAKS